MNTLFNKGYRFGGNQPEKTNTTISIEIFDDIIDDDIDYLFDELNIVSSTNIDDILDNFQNVYEVIDMISSDV
jgi:hypothetical protein